MPGIERKENTGFKDMWETMKVDLWGKYITIDAYLQQNKTERS